MTRFSDPARTRALLWMLVVREFRVRAAGSFLGMFWIFLQPAFMVLIYGTVFSGLMSEKLGASGVSTYVVHLCAGVIPWMLFSDILLRSTGTLIEQGNYLRKMAMPETVLFFGVYVSSLATGIASLAALSLYRVASGVGVLGAVAEFAFSALIMAALGLVAVGIGMVLSVMNLLLRDVGQALSILIQFGFWTLPIAYVPKILPEGLRTAVEWHPLLPFIGEIQRIYGSPDTLQSPTGLLGALLIPAIATAGGFWFLAKNKSEILDRL